MELNSSVIELERWSKTVFICLQHDCLCKKNLKNDTIKLRQPISEISRVAKYVIVQKPLNLCKLAKKQLGVKILNAVSVGLATKSSIFWNKLNKIY